MYEQDKVSSTINTNLQKLITSVGRGIGFLADMRRMNVGLTRAKYSLFVLGHARSLSNSEYWGDLVYDARRRSLITDVRTKRILHNVILK